MLALFAAAGGNWNWLGVLRGSSLAATWLTGHLQPLVRSDLANCLELRALMWFKVGWPLSRKLFLKTH